MGSLDLTQQSECYESSIRKAPDFEQKLYNQFRQSKSIHTLNDVLSMGLTVSGDGPCIGKLDESNSVYNWLSYSSVSEKVVKIGLGLRHLATLSGSKFKIGLISTKHLADCLIIEYGCYYGGLTVVPLDENISPKDYAPLLNRMNIGCVIVDTPDRVQALTSQSECLPNLKFIVVIENILESYRSKANGYGLTVKTLDQVIEIGEEDPIHPEDKTKPNDVALIIHPNSLTNKAEGVVLSHGSILSNAIAITIRLGKHAPTRCDILFCYMPITKMNQRCVQIAVLMAGGRLGFSENEFKHAWKDMECLKPTILVTLPYLIKSLHDKLFLKVKGNLIAEWFVKRSLTTVGRCSGRQRLSVWQAFVLSKIRNKLGGNLRLIIVTKSHLPRYLMNFIRLSLGATVCSSYGLKETSGPCTMSFPDDESTEHVGPPLPNVSIKLISIKNLQELHLSAEICVQGDNLFSGYLIDEQNNQKVEDWHSTGDIGFWRANGTLEIIGRACDVVKLSGGKLIAPRKIESIYSQSQFINNLYLHGELNRPLVGIVNPTKYYLTIWARENNLKGTYYDICKEQKAHEEIIADLRSLGRRHGLEPYQQIKIITLVSENFSPKNGLCNSVFLTNRQACATKFKQLITGMHNIDLK
ncbi:long-chain-fatty-acid--CoA ligase 6-like [Tetranychus urticae]|uniref:long-chain-fatty-acid--CoA ligase n=1 Tax=Tetranychus urticae TaxID=32264 RepID=T1KJR7_TETUR|nr:long-chain-fatty-acid--CoA ligase 6-like [Tetranychus urticae]